MKLLELTNMLPALNALGNQKIPVKAGYRVAKAINLLKSDLAVYDEQRTKLLQEFGTLSDDKASYNFTGDSGKLFQTAHQQLLDEECTLVLPTIKLSELGELNFEPVHLAALTAMLDDDTPV